mgnify:FL=1
MGDIARDINNIDENIMIKDKNLIKMLRREEIKLYQVEGEKDLYTL